MTRPASTGLAHEVLPLIRTRAELYQWRASNAHGKQMHEAVDILEASMASTDPQEVFAVTTKAIASAMKVIARAKAHAIAAGMEHVTQVDELVAELRQANRHRPRLQQEFDRAGLPAFRVR